MPADSDGVRRRILFASQGLALGEFRCPPHSCLWRTTNVMGCAPHVVFPRTSVVIEHVGAEAVLANPNHVMFYNPEQRYVRRLRDARGDHCYFVAVKPTVLDEAAGCGGHDFTFSHGPSDARTYLLFDLVVRHLQEERPDLLMVEETLAGVIGRSVDNARAIHRVPARSRPRTRDEHHSLAEEAKELLSSTACERLSLGELAGRMHASEYHLARVFRASTGFTLHGYRTHLRLRLALDRLCDPGASLAVLAYELGFASHSHLTDTFRSVFGLNPSAVRAGLGKRGLRELRRIVEAPLLVHS